MAVASTGGHLEQLYRWCRRWAVDPANVSWVTFENSQSRSLLRGSKTRYVKYVSPRDIRGTVAAIGPIREEIAAIRATRVVSTGAAVAVSAAIASRASAVPFTYIESLARVDRRSLTANILACVPSIDRWVQSESIASSKFIYGGTILDDFRTTTHVACDPSKSLKVLVTVGTIRPYGFNRLIRGVEQVTQADAVTWQTGYSSHVPSHGTVTDSLSRDLLLTEMRSANVVVTHGGVGSILSALETGHVPVVLPRLKCHDEHIDDHQLDIVRLLAERGLVLEANDENLSRDLLIEASGRASVTSPLSDC